MPTRSLFGPQFRPKSFDATPEHERLYSYYERLYTFVDMGAAWCFVIGSVMFFSEAWVTPGVWLFTIGSLLFAARPTIRLLREYRLAALPVPGEPAPGPGAHDRALERIREAVSVGGGDDDTPRARRDGRWDGPSVAEAPTEPRPLSRAAPPAWTPDGDIAREGGRTEGRDDRRTGADDDKRTDDD
ncbi:MAG: YrhK family protein [Paracoccaceae bacterium]